MTRSEVRSKIIEEVEPFFTDVEGLLDELERTVVDEARESLGPFLTRDQCIVACRNIGYDLACGACSEIFYTGTTTSSHDLTCKTLRGISRSWWVHCGIRLDELNYCPECGEKRPAFDVPSQESRGDSRTGEKTKGLEHGEKRSVPQRQMFTVPEDGQKILRGYASLPLILVAGRMPADLIDSYWEKLSREMGFDIETVVMIPHTPRFTAVARDRSGSRE